MVGPIPDGLDARGGEGRASIVAPGYIELSGTSFAAPVVSGTVAQIAGARTRPGRPDQVKGG